MSLAVVPVRSLEHGKSRLRTALGGAPLPELILAMLSDLLEALARVERVARCVVLTPDPRVAETARNHGASALVRDDSGLNPAIDAAARELAPGDDTPWLVVLGDVAAARTADLSRLYTSLDGLGAPGAVCAPSRDGGTSALLRLPADCLPSRFGPDSAERHAAAARECGVPFEKLELPSLTLDLDTPEDLDALERFGPGPHTARWLERWRPVRVAPA